MNKITLAKTYLDNGKLFQGMSAVMSNRTGDRIISTMYFQGETTKDEIAGMFLCF